MRTRKTKTPAQLEAEQLARMLDDFESNLYRLPDRRFWLQYGRHDIQDPKQAQQIKVDFPLMCCALGPPHLFGSERGGLDVIGGREWACWQFAQRNAQGAGVVLCVGAVAPVAVEYFHLTEFYAVDYDTEGEGILLEWLEHRLSQARQQRLQAA